MRGRQTSKRQWVYSRLVQGRDDMLGLIAYGLYKARKSELAESYRRNGLTEEVIVQKLREFHDQTVHGNGALEQYRGAATRYLDDLLKDAYARGRVEAAEDLSSAAQDAMASGRSWWRKALAWLVSGLPSALATLVLTLLVFGVAMLLASPERRAQVASDAVNGAAGEPLVVPKTPTPVTPAARP